MQVADIARGAALPRTTTIRLLETLRGLGYLARDINDRKYRLTINVHQLADGYRDESWVSDIARPHVEAITRRTGWPFLLAMPLGPSMVWHVNTDHLSAAVMQRFRVGMRIPLHRSASGLVFLAFASSGQRKATMDLLGATWIAQQGENVGRQDLEDKLARIRGAGYAIYSRPEEGESAIAVPLLTSGRYLASLAMRYAYRSMPEQDMRERHLSTMQATARAIATEFARLAGSSWGRWQKNRAR